MSSKGQDTRLKDPNRAVQEATSTNLEEFADFFQASSSGHGSSRIQCLTHDTKKALVQTTKGLAALSKHLINIANFSYVLTREIQSDRIEGEFGVYRQSTGANALMTVGDVSSASKKRLARHAATFLMSINTEEDSKAHECVGPINIEDAASLKISLTSSEQSACTYVAGWLESKSPELQLDEDEPLVTNEAKCFIEEVSRGSLTIPHECTQRLVEVGLCFVKKARHRACCTKRLSKILTTMATFYKLDVVTNCQKLMTRLSNVLLHGLHNLEKDQQKVLFQTSIKKARMSD